MRRAQQLRAQKQQISTGKPPKVPVSATPVVAQPNQEAPEVVPMDDPLLKRRVIKRIPGIAPA